MNKMLLSQTAIILFLICNPLNGEDSDSSNSASQSSGSSSSASQSPDSSSSASQSSDSNESPFAQDFIIRRELMTDSVLEVGPNLILDAFRGNDLDQDQLDAKLCELNKKNAEFDLIDIVRVLYLTGDDYEDDILNGIEGMENYPPLWLNTADLKQRYWTENHMIMWDSSAFLLKQKFDALEINDNVRNRIISFLQLKIDHGFFELNSATYVPFTMKAILNLVDFSEDDTIQYLAKEALEVLLLEVINNVNSEGAYYPAMARANDDDYIRPGDMFGRSIMRYLLTGLGPLPDTSNNDRVNIHLAATDVNNLENILGSYREIIDTQSISVGIPIEDFDTFNDEINYPLSIEDRTVFQLSGNLYWIPETVNDTLDLINQFDLWNHPEFALCMLFEDPFGNTGLTYQQLRPLTTGALINEITSVLYKNGPAMLSSFQEFNFRLLASDQYVWAATTGTLAVWSKSGDGSSMDAAHVHLPWVKQTENVALVVYDSSLMSVSPYKDLLNVQGVSEIKKTIFYFDVDGFDTVAEDGNWILAKEIGSDGMEGYVALRRDSSCVNTIINGQIDCDEVKSAWGVIVGSQAKYENFLKFQNIVSKSTYDEANNRLTIDGITIEFGSF